MQTQPSGLSCSGVVDCGLGGHTTPRNCSRGCPFGTPGLRGGPYSQPHPVTPCSATSRGRTFQGTTVGLAPVEGMCRAESSGGVSTVSSAGDPGGEGPGQGLWSSVKPGSPGPLGTPHRHSSHHGPRDRPQPGPPPRPRRRLLRGGRRRAGRLRHGGSHRVRTHGRSVPPDLLASPVFLWLPPSVPSFVKWGDKNLFMGPQVEKSQHGIRVLGCSTPDRWFPWGLGCWILASQPPVCQPPVSQVSCVITRVLCPLLSRRLA